MYDAIVARPEGASTVARMALTAADYGFDGVVVRNAGDQRPGYDREVIAEAYDVDVVDGVEIVTEDPSRASGFLGNHRPNRTVVAVRGGTAAMNRFAVERPAVDVLARPLGLAPDGPNYLAIPENGRSDPGADDGATGETKSDDGAAGEPGADDGAANEGAPDDGGTDDGETDDGETDDGEAMDVTVDDSSPHDVDHVVVKTAAENGVRIELSLAPLVGRTGGSRVRAIQSLRRLRSLVEAYDAPYVVTAGARSHLELRGPRDLSALGDVIGLSPDGVKAGLREWGEIVERNRDRQSAAFVEPGVWRCEDE